MTATAYPDMESATGDVGRLRVDYCDKLAAKKDVHGAEEQAVFFKLHRSTYYRLRNGERKASLPTALRMARMLGTTVHKLFVDEAV